MILANTSNRGLICVFSLNETSILVLQNVTFEFKHVLRGHCLL